MATLLFIMVSGLFGILALGAALFLNREGLQDLLGMFSTTGAWLYLLLALLFLCEMAVVQTDKMAALSRVQRRQRRQRLWICGVGFLLAAFLSYGLFDL